MMQFHVSNQHVRRDRRKCIFVIVFLLAVAAGLVAKMLSTGKVSDQFFPIVAVFFVASVIINSYKRIKEGSSGYPTLQVDESSRKVAVQHKDLVVVVDLANIKKLRLQRKSGRLVSILVKTSSGESLRFEGYEKLDDLASVLERLTPVERITHASFYHR